MAIAMETSTKSIPASANATPVHLVVLSHGLWGEPINLHTVETLLQRSFGERATIVRSKAAAAEDSAQKTSSSKEGSPSPSSSSSSSDEDDVHVSAARLTKRHNRLLNKFASDVRKNVEMDVVILNASSNAGGKTYDGVDWLGERVLEEIKDQRNALHAQGKRIGRFSMIGYSLGGLVARFVIGLLESEGFFGGDVEARQLITIATPHIGSPPGAGAFGRVVSYVGARLLSRTGEQLYSVDGGWETDKDADERVGLLEYMSRPSSVFMRGLRRFEKVHFYANAVNDITVPFRTGCIEEWDPFVERAGHVDVKVLSDAPILTNVNVGEVPKQTLSQAVARIATPSLPVFFRPSRLPFGYPWNYVVVFGSPVLVPVFAVRILLRLSNESKRSQGRIADLERGWEVKQTGKESRVEKLVKGIVLGQDDEGIQSVEVHDLHNDDYDKNGATERRQRADEAVVNVDEQADRPPWHSPWRSDMMDAQSSREVKKQAPLLPAQQRMVRNLNDARYLPNLTKVWAYFDDVNNAHAIIVARSLSVEPHQRGLSIVKHIVDDFLP